MNKNVNKLTIISSVTMLLLLTSCSNYHKPLSSSGVKMKDVASESYESFKGAVEELKTAFFTTTTQPN